MTRKPRIRSASLACAGILMLLAPRARAQTAERTAERLFNEALSRVAAGDYKAACPKFEQSQDLDPALGTQFDLADCYEHTGKVADARRLFVEVEKAAHAAGKTAREKSAHDRAALLDAKLGKLAIVASGDVAITVDGVPLPDGALKVDPGPHSLVITGKGKKPVTQRVNVAAGETLEWTAPTLEADAESGTPTPAPKGEPPPDRPYEHDGSNHGLAIVVGGVGAVGIVAGTVAGVLAIIKHEQASSECADHAACPSAAGRADWDAATTAGSLSTVGFVVGGVGTAAAAVLWLLAPAPASKNVSASTVILPTVGPGCAGAAAVLRF